MQLTDQVIKNIIKRLIKGQDYRIEVVALINAEFLQFAMDFFKKVIEAKLNDKNLTIDWYKKTFLNPKLSGDEIAINSGLNKKTIVNMYNSATKQIIIDAANEHYDVLYESISSLIEAQPDIDLTLTIKFKGVSVDLNINESLIVINTLAVKRAALRGGAWATAGKRVEKYLMVTLCMLHKVPFVHFDQTLIPQSIREVDFYIKNGDKAYRCEVKLMGAGNPESGDGPIARKSDIFVADKLSINKKTELDESNIHWVELRSEEGYRRIVKIFEAYKIPYSPFQGDLDKQLNLVLNKIME